MSSDKLAEEEVPLKKVRAAALALLTRRSYTRRQLEEKLRKKDFPPQAISQVINECLAKGYVDDYAYALRFAEGGLKRKGWGPGRVELELRNKGVGAEERRRALEEIFGGVDQAALARDLLRKKRRGSAENDPLKEKRRLAGFLSRRGFSAEVIGRVLREREED